MAVVGSPINWTSVPEGDIKVIVRSPRYSWLNSTSTPQIPWVGLDRLLSTSPDTANWMAITSSSGIGVDEARVHWP